MCAIIHHVVTLIDDESPLRIGNGQAVS